MGLLLVVLGLMSKVRSLNDANVTTPYLDQQVIKVLKALPWRVS